MLEENGHAWKLFYHKNILMVLEMLFVTLFVDIYVMWFFSYSKKYFLWHFKIKETTGKPY